eukprot:4059061-Amphidinium_carterae.1
MGCCGKGNAYRKCFFTDSAHVETLPDEHVLRRASSPFGGESWSLRGRLVECAFIVGFGRMGTSKWTETSPCRHWLISEWPCHGERRHAVNGASEALPIFSAGLLKYLSQTPTNKMSKCPNKIVTKHHLCVCVCVPACWGKELQFLHGNSLDGWFDGVTTRCVFGWHGVGDLVTPDHLRRSAWHARIGISSHSFKVCQEEMTITVEGGARVAQILDELKKHDMTLANFSSITEQQIGGWTQADLPRLFSEVSPFRKVSLLAEHLGPRLIALPLGGGCTWHRRQVAYSR